ncbi:MAG: hypothetical protein AAGA31_09970 [Bacteroidota bacterium]
MSKQVSVEEALALISSGVFTLNTEVVFDKVVGVEALDAVKLGEAGVDVPEELIYYNDDAIVEDSDFAGPWENIVSDTKEEKKFLKLEMKIDPEIGNWLSSNDVDVNLLVEKLIEDAYRTSKLLKR